MKDHGIRNVFRRAAFLIRQPYSICGTSCRGDRRGFGFDLVDLSIDSRHYAGLGTTTDDNRPSS